MIAVTIHGDFDPHEFTTRVVNEIEPVIKEAMVRQRRDIRIRELLHAGNYDPEALRLAFVMEGEDAS